MLGLGGGRPASVSAPAGPTTAPAESWEQVVATGGIVFDITDENGADWRVHRFIGIDTFDVSSAGEVECVIASGGGGGPYSEGGGAGGGGVHRLTLNVPVGSHSVVVGAGGSPGVDQNSANRHGNKGSDSGFLGFWPVGGGGGVGPHQNSPGGRIDGGSGGGHRMAGYHRVGYGISYQGHDGGIAAQSAGYSGGGGGFSGPGGNAVDGKGGDAGPGMDVSDMIGEALFVGAGGPGRAANSNHGDPAPGGSAATESGAVNTGNGGGGSGSQSGGSGVVIVRYRI